MRTPRRRVSLWSLPARSWPGVARRTLKESSHDRITMSAASLAFHAFLALLPVVIAAVALLGLVGLPGGALHDLVHATSVLLPRQMSAVLNEQLLKPSKRPVSLFEIILGILVALWSSIEAMSALQIALDQAYETGRDRGLIGRRIAAIPLIGLTLVLGGVASVLLVLGGPIGHLLPSGFDPLLTATRYGGSLVLLVLMLSAYYSFGPDKATFEWEWISPGGVVAAVGWVAASVGFSFYLDHFGHEARDYGALAGVAVTLLWMFLTGILVLFGAELNRELERTAEADSSTAGTGASR